MKLQVLFFRTVIWRLDYFCNSYFHLTHSLIHCVLGMQEVDGDRGSQWGLREFDKKNMEVEAYTCEVVKEIM